MMKYNESVWNIHCNEEKYSKCVELEDAVRAISHPSHRLQTSTLVDHFCKLLCEAYFLESEYAIEFFKENNFDESNAYAILDDMKSLEKYLNDQAENDEQNQYGE